MLCDGCLCLGICGSVLNAQSWVWHWQVWDWEPIKCHDVIDVSWNKVADMSINSSFQLVGCTFNQSFCGVWVVNLQVYSRICQILSRASLRYFYIRHLFSLSLCGRLLLRTAPTGPTVRPISPRLRSPRTQRCSALQHCLMPGSMHHRICCAIGTGTNH